MNGAKIFTVSVIIILSVLSFVCLAQYQIDSQRQINRTSSRSLLSPKNIIQLPEPNSTSNFSLERTLAERRSVRQFSQRRLRFSQIGQLAWAGQGITESQKGFRTAPSAGAVYPLTLYIAINKGLFIYHPQEHCLEQISSGDARSKLAEAALNQSAVADAACDIIIFGSVNKLRARYQNKARDYMLLEAGHAAQNILLQAVSLDLAGVPIGAFNIQRVRELCRITRGMEPLYIICAGYPVRQQPGKKQSQQRQSQQRRNQNRMRVKRAVLIVPSMNFQGAELTEIRNVLTNASVLTVTASTKVGTITSMTGGKSHSELSVANISVDDYDAIIFIGGTGINEYLFNPVAGRIIKEAVDKGKILGAISNAPLILSNAGVLKGRKVTALPTNQIYLDRNGAQYTGAYVEEDGLIITAAGSQMAGQFGRTIAEKIKEVFGTIASPRTGFQMNR